MSSPYIGEIRMFGGNFAPLGWSFCDGSILPISSYTALFSLLGTTYGGDGTTTFALPDLRGRVPVHAGTGLFTATMGDMAGVESVTLTTAQIPAHTHALQATTSFATSSDPAGNAFAQGQAVKEYSTFAPDTTLASGTTSAAGGSQPHDNFQPYLCLNFIIALQGVFP